MFRIRCIWHLAGNFNRCQKIVRKRLVELGEFMQSVNEFKTRLAVASIISYFFWSRLGSCDASLFKRSKRPLPPCRQDLHEKKLHRCRGVDRLYNQDAQSSSYKNDHSFKHRDRHFLVSDPFGESLPLQRQPCLSRQCQVPSNECYNLFVQPHYESFPRDPTVLEVASY